MKIEKIAAYSVAGKLYATKEQAVHHVERDKRKEVALKLNALFEAWRPTINEKGETLFALLLLAFGGPEEALAGLKKAFQAKPSDASLLAAEFSGLTQGNDPLLSEEEEEEEITAIKKSRKRRYSKHKTAWKQEDLERLLELPVRKRSKKAKKELEEIFQRSYSALETQYYLCTNKKLSGEAIHNDTWLVKHEATIRDAIPELRSGVMTYAELAELFGKSEEAVRQRVKRIERMDALK